MKKEKFTQVDHHLLQDPNLKVLEVLIYCYIQSWLKTNEKCFISNARIAKDLGQKSGMIKYYIAKLESKGLLKRWHHNNTRYLKTLPYDSQITDHSQKTDHSQNTDHSIDKKPTTGSQKVDHTIDKKLARYNTSYNTNNNTKNNIPISEVDEELLGNIISYWRKYDKETLQEDLKTLSRKEQNELHKFVKNHFEDNHKAFINIVIKDKLYKGDKYKKWLNKNKPKPIVSKSEYVNSSSEETLGF